MSKFLSEGGAPKIVDTNALINTRGSAGEAALQALADEIVLPSEKTQLSNDLAHFSYFFMGKQKTGKSSLTTQFDPDTCHIFYEPSGEDYSLYQVEPASWSWFKAFVLKNRQLKEAGTPRYKFFVIDIVDLCYMQCLRDVCKRKGVDYPPEDFGKTWNEIKDEFRYWLLELKKCGGLILVSHVTEKPVERMDGTKYEIQTSSCSAQCFDVVSKFVSLTGFYYVDRENKRWLGITPNYIFEAGNRLKHHFFWKGTKDKIDKIPMGKSEEEAFKNFKLAFDNLLEKPISEEPEPESNGAIVPETKIKKKGFLLSK